MMGRKPKKPDDEPWDRITQSCPGAKVRFDPLVIPELMAWLTIRGTRYRKVVEQLTVIPDRDRTEYMRGVIRYNETAVQLIDELIQTVFDKWSRHEWNEIVSHLDKALREAVAPPATGPAPPDTAA